MRLLLKLLAFGGVAAAYFSMSAFAPGQPFVHTKMINARGKAFIIGAAAPSTYCPVKDKDLCPPGIATLVNEEMTLLAASVPGSQLIYVAPDGSISYTPAHSTLHPPGSQIGGFFQYQIQSECGMPLTALSWKSNGGSVGLWACPVDGDTTNYQEAELKATTTHFKGEGCIPVGVLIQDAGDDFGAWAYT